MACLRSRNVHNNVVEHVRRIGLTSAGIWLLMSNMRVQWVFVSCHPH